MESKLHLAGHRIRQWRTARQLTVAQFTTMLAQALDRNEPICRATVQNWESRGRVARPAVQKALIAMGVCTAEDWLAPAPPPAPAKDAA